jgi:hypothetical protein
MCIVMMTDDRLSVVDVFGCYARFRTTLSRRKRRKYVKMSRRLFTCTVKTTSSLVAPSLVLCTVSTVRAFQRRPGAGTRGSGAVILTLNSTLSGALPRVNSFAAGNAASVNWPCVTMRLVCFRRRLLHAARVLYDDLQRSGSRLNANVVETSGSEPGVIFEPMVCLLASVAHRIVV